VLFADNCKTPSNVSDLNYALQQAAKGGGHSPLFHAIRSRRWSGGAYSAKLATSFQLIWSIGAPMPKHGDLLFARLSALKSLLKKLSIL